MTITYDAEGKCTRCGSTGYYLGSYTSDSSFEDTRTCVKPCPCHGWRPIEFAPKGQWVRLLIMVHVGLSVTNLQPTGRLALGTWEILQEKAGRLPRGLTPSHWQPLHQPPEGV